MKLAKRLLSVLLAALVCLSAVGLSASAKKAGELKVGDTFAYGFYPQTLVTDPDLLDILDTQTPDSNGDVTLGTGTFRKYHFEIPDAYAQNKDEYAGHIQTYLEEVYNQYKAYLDAYGYKSDSFDYWFAYEPIQWRVLEVRDDGNVLLMADTVLDARAFEEKPDFDKDINWANSSIQRWLNGTFMNTAFTKEEQAWIQPQTLSTPCNPVKGTPGGDDIECKVFLPSFEEMNDSALGFIDVGTKTDYGYDENGNKSTSIHINAGYDLPDDARRAKSSDFAKSHGVWSDLKKKLENGSKNPDYGYCRYWLRSTGFENGYAAGVLEDGIISTGWLVNNWILGVRPMICVSPDAVSASLRIYASDGTVRYRQEGVRIFANMANVEWTSSNPEIAEIDEDGNILISDVGTVTITATLKDDPETTAECKLEIKYAWWQQLVRIFLFGWLWY